MKLLLTLFDSIWVGANTYMAARTHDPIWIGVVAYSVMFVYLSNYREQN